MAANACLERLQIRALVPSALGTIVKIQPRPARLAAMRPLELVASLFEHAVSGGADVATLGEADLGLGAHVERELSTPGALEAVRLALFAWPRPRALTAPPCAAASR